MCRATYGSDEAVRLANDSPYGLGGSVWSRDVEAAADVGARLACGMVWINEAQHVTPATPFGGHKQSGLGVENGAEGFLQYTALQTVVVRKAQAA